jgi:hypothetical protein
MKIGSIAVSNIRDSSVTNPKRRLRPTTAPTFFFDVRDIEFFDDQGSENIANSSRQAGRISLQHAPRMVNAAETRADEGGVEF